MFKQSVKLQLMFFKASPVCQPLIRSNTKRTAHRTRKWESGRL